ncbi:hypothetical protein VM1G_04666 [Cytospora mali]|uniref:Uncharacterized protein n=1 Tax=Cytospora mali TaxID=578113 RepID=A0A194VX85_CYTMA|nr:hypothetical protein VM1G_04666 [Valsa mali]
MFILSRESQASVDQHERKLRRPYDPTTTNDNTTTTTSPNPGAQSGDDPFAYTRPPFPYAPGECFDIKPHNPPPPFDGGASSIHPGEQPLLKTRMFVS